MVRGNPWAVLGRPKNNKPKKTLGIFPRGGEGSPTFEKILITSQHKEKYGTQEKHAKYKSTLTASRSRARPYVPFKRGGEPEISAGLGRHRFHGGPRGPQRGPVARLGRGQPWPCHWAAAADGTESDFLCSTESKGGGEGTRTREKHAAKNAKIKILLDSTF